MSDEPIGRREFEQFMGRFSDLREQIDGGFAGINDRLDRLNGTTAATVKDLAEVRSNGCAQLKVHRVTLANLDRLIDGAVAVVGNTSGPGSRWHDKPAVKIAGWGAGAGAIVYEVVEFLRHMAR